MYVSWFLVAALLLSPLALPLAWGKEMPPQNAKPLSDLIKMAEQRPDFHAIKEVEFEDGAYEIEYYTKEGAEKELKINPVSGEAQ